MKEDVLVQNIKNDVSELNGRIDSIQDLAKLRSELKKIRKKSGKWEIVKEKGIKGMPKGIQEKAKILLNDLKKIGIFLPPVAH